MDHRRVLESEPLPLSRCFRRFRNAAETREAHDAAYYLFEVYLKYTAASAIASYLAGAERDHKVNAVLKGLARPSLGEWLRFLKECVRFLVRSETPDPAMRAISELLEHKESRWREVLGLFNALRSFDSKRPSQKEGASLEEVLSEVVSYRNRVLGHGAPLAAEHYERFGRLFAAAFTEILDFSPFLTSRRLVAFDSIQVEDGSRIECRAIEYMGLNPIRRESPLTLPYGAEAPRKQCLHLLGEDGKFLPLDPLLVAEKEDVYILNHAQGGAEYLSYSSGERHRPSGMEASQGDLFERILGYRVDEARLSRMGDEVAAAGTPPTAAEPAGDGARRLGDYRIVREVGRGGMGTVFEAFQESLGRRVALKVLPGSFALDPRRLERFRREARSTARIHHPSIVPVYEVGESGGTHYYSMEFIDGTSLDDLLAEARKNGDSKGNRRRISSTSDPASIARVVEQVAALAEGLEAAHRQGLVHRDVKPSNILVEGTQSSGGKSIPLGWRTGRYVLVDFGLVHDTEAQTLTRSGEMVGTLGYMSPEQVSRGEVDARADVYSLGATLYEILTSRTPFDAKSEHEVQRAVLFEEPPPPRRFNARLHRDLETILLKCLEKNPEKRYASAGALAKDLRRFLRYEPIEARPQTALSRLGKRAWKHRVPLATVGVIGVLALSVLFFASQSRQEARLRREGEYDPKVLAAVMKIEQSAISRKADAGESPLEIGDLNVVLAEAGLDPLAEAVAALGEAIAWVPRRPEAHYHRARALRYQKRDDEALSDLARVAAIDPGFIPAIILEAGIREKRGEMEAGARLRERARAAAAEGGWKEAWLRAQDALRTGLWAEADKAFGEIIALESKGGEAYLGASFLTRLGRGRARLEGKNYFGAIEDFAALESRWPEAREPVLLKGKTYHVMGEKEMAEALFDKVHKEAPAAQKDDVAMAVGKIYESLDLKKMLEWQKRISIEFFREWSMVFPLYWLGYPEEAARAARRSLELNPNFAGAYRELGFTLTMLGRYTEALECLRKGAERWPRDVWMWWRTGLCYWSSGRNVEAAAAFEKALEVEPKSAHAHTYLALVLENLGDMDLAEEHHGKAKAHYPLYVDGLYHRGRVLRDLGRLEESLEELDRAIRVDPTDSWARTQKGLTLERQEKLEEAMKEYRAATAASPPGGGHLDLGRLLERQGKRDEAFVEYASLLKVSPRRRDGHVAAQGLLRKKEAALPAAGLESLITVLEAALPANADRADLLLTLALARLRLSGEEGAAKTLEPIRAALGRKGGKDLDLSLVLGEVLLLSGKAADALAVLEPAARSVHATVAFPKLIEECQKALLSRLATPASVEAALARKEREVIIPGDAVWKYFKGTSEPPEAWAAHDFEDPGWPEGKSGLGYGDDDDATPLGDMQEGYTTLYVRRKFTAPEGGRFERLILSLEVDDGAVVYLNGEEIGRVRAGVPGARLAHDAIASSTVDNAEHSEFSLDAARLVPGENVIAVQGLNFRNSSDFSLIPSLLGELPRSASDRERLLEAVRGADGEPDRGLLALVEGLLLVEEGKHREAAEKLAAAARAFPRDPIPHLRLAGCLRSAGDARAAGEALRRAIEGGLDDREVWDLWAAVSLVDLKFPKEVLAVFPKFPGDEPGTAAPGYAGDLRWLLETLAKGESVRINCGGEDHTTRDGHAFARDRFYLSGFLPGERGGNPFAFTLGIEKTEDDVLYQSERWFPPDLAGRPGYRIPLPPGEYRVTLHFAEWAFRKAGWRSFGVLLEGREELTDYEPLKAGFATAESKTFRTLVDDGLLDLQFVPGINNPLVSAIEVEPAPRAP